MTKQKISVTLNIDKDAGMIDMSFWNVYNATVTLDGVEYDGDISFQQDIRGSADFPGLPQSALNGMRWVPYWVIERISDLEDEDGFVNKDECLFNAASLVEYFNDAFSDQFSDHDEYELA